MNEKRNQMIAWIFFGLIAASNIAALLNFFLMSPLGDKPSLFEAVFPFVPVLFAFVGALIISRQPRNVIGLMMMLPGLSMAFLIDAFLAPYLSGQLPPPSAPSLMFLMILWFSNWNWLLLVLPIMFIMILFPTGRPLGPRWNWLVYIGLGILAIFILMITFAEVLAPGTDSSVWQVPNPIGFLKSEWIDAITGPFLILFPLWILLCAVSLFVRFRCSKGVEREQIKWLFYAGAIFVVFYMPSFIASNFSQTENLWNLLLPIGMSTFPAAIGIAILRYRLYDIDVIIRKTLQYTLLTGSLALVYFGSVVLLQNLVENLTGEQSPIVIVLSTLVIAALFTPLRQSIQAFVDRRFYRRKYDAEQALGQFSVTVRDEVNMNMLTVALLGVVEETMQPERVNLWLKKEESRR